MKDLSELFFNIYSVYSFSYFWGGLAFLGRINTRVYTKLLPQYQTVQRCAVPTKPIFQHLEQVKFKFWGRMGGSTSTLDGVYQCKIDKRSEWICTKLTSEGVDFFGFGWLVIRSHPAPQHRFTLTYRRQIRPTPYYFYHLTPTRSSINYTLLILPLYRKFDLRPANLSTQQLIWTTTY